MKKIYRSEQKAIGKRQKVTVTKQIVTYVFYPLQFAFYFLHFALYPLSFAFCFLLFASSANAQIIIKNGTAAACGGLFYDSGGPNAGYKANENYTFTICSNDPKNNHISLGFNYLDIRPGDDLCFFDGKLPTDSLLACASDLVNNSNSIVETTSKNASGCITARFRSDATDQGGGWAMFITCIPSCQTVKAVIDATTPVVQPKDTGYIDVCPNVTMVNFKAHGIYPLNHYAYSQSDSLSKFEWNFEDGSSVAYGTNVSHVFTQSGGYKVRLTVIDTFGCKNVNYISQRVRVSPKPAFNIGTIPNNICVGTSVQLNSRVDKLDKSFSLSAQPNTGIFSLQGIRSGRLFIPDDSSRVYQTSINFSDFSPGQAFTQASDLSRLFVNMEHSFARDLEIKLICPNGQSSIVHKYDYPTRFTNKIKLGLPNLNDARGSLADLLDSTKNPPGFGYTYGWTNASTRTWRSFTTPSPGEIFLPAGDYKPEQPFSNLVGCPLNGEWKLQVRDLFNYDNGWIFYWGIDFNKSLYPVPETFNTKITTHGWQMNPTIVMYNTDSVFARPANAGVATYKYVTVDDFGCAFDTTVTVSVLPKYAPNCKMCDQTFNSLRDTAACYTGIPINLDKSALKTVNERIKFEAFPQAKLDSTTANAASPFVSILPVNYIFPQKILATLQTLDSVCVDISTQSTRNFMIDLQSPSGQKLRLFDKHGTVGANQMHKMCFSPSATQNISSAAPPFSGLYQPEGGKLAWDSLKGATLNGNWKLVVSLVDSCSLFVDRLRVLCDEQRATSNDQLNSWFLCFKGGNDLKYTWKSANALSCTNCPTPVVQQVIGNAIYSVSITDSLKCLYRDSVKVQIKDSLRVLNAAVSKINYHDVTFTWSATPRVTLYEVSINGGAWQPANGILQHTAKNLPSGQTANFAVRAVRDVTCNVCTDCGIQPSALVAKTLACQATIGTGANRKLIIDSIKCYNGKSPSINFKYAQGFAPFTFIIDTLQQTSDGVFVNKIPAGTHRAVFIDGTGCSDTLSFSLGQPDSIKINALPDSVKCFGNTDGKITLNPTGGTAPYTYGINNSTFGNANFFSGLSTKAYKLSVRDANNCIQNDSVSVLSPQKINTQLATIDVHCFGDSTGKIAATTIGGILPYKFNWSNGATTSAIANLKAQKYVFTITDANGCVKMDSATLQQNSQIVLSPSSDSVKCFGGTNGTARVSVTGGQAPYNYRWANNALDSFIKNVSAGIYSVSVTDGSGCSTALNVPVFQPLLLKIDSVVATPKMCYNVNNGQAKVFASGGTKNYVYNWSNGQNSVTATNLSSGKIKVTVTDAYSCTVNDTSFIKSPDSISGYFTATSITCNGSSTGSLKINATGGTGNFNYIWSTNPKQTNSSISKLPTGKYTVTISDANNCVSQRDTSLIEPPKLIAGINNFTNAKCKNSNDGTATVVAKGGSPFSAPQIEYLYKWSDPLQQETSTVFKLSKGTYTVTVTDSKGCTDVATVFIDEPAVAVTVSATQTRLACFGQNNGEMKAIGSGGTGTYIYLWSNLQNTQTVTNVSKGRYYILLKDYNGCFANDSIDVATYDSISMKLTATPPTCNSFNDGSVSVTSILGGAGGNNLKNFALQWNSTPIQTTATAQKVKGDKTYSLRVTDSIGCQNTGYIYLPQPGPITFTTATQSVKCFRGTDGEAQINPQSTINVFTYKWSPQANNQTTQRATNLVAGSYGVTVTDSTGCKINTTVTVVQPNKLALNPKIIINNKCVGDTSGSVSVSALGGTSPYKILWSNNQNSFHISSLKSGIYILTVVDNNGCTITDTAHITSPTALDADLSISNALCFGSSEGAIMINAFNGTPPYEFSLDGKNFASSNRFVGIKPNNYNVFARDANGCLWFDKATIKSPPQFIISLTDSVSINLGDSLTLTPTVTNNQGDATYQWLPSYDGTLSCLKCISPIAKPPFSIDYVVVATDSVGCRATASEKVTVYKQRGILVPTGFTPNGDNVNDVLRVHGKPGTKIKTFRIYDRWGELLYQSDNFSVNDENFGWDGTFKGQIMGSGMYVWYAEALYPDGTTEIDKGNTTLIR